MIYRLNKFPFPCHPLFRFNDKAGYIPSMYLQPYNNPRAGFYNLQRRMHSSTLNLATSREPQASYPDSISEESSPQLDSAGESRGAAGRLYQARSLDALSEALSQTQTERDASTPDGRTRSRSNTSFSSSSSESSSSLKEEAQHQRRRPDASESSPDLSLSHRRGSITSSSSGSVTSKGSETASVGPRVPPRPKTEEILSRCTTMTRKAALATKTRLQIQPESTHSR